MKKNVKKITVGGLLIALALVLPMAFHLTGVPQPGQVFCLCTYLYYSEDLF